ncbi:MAG: Ig-like domain-containing protein [Chthoniobacterales bacterium]
MTTIIRCVALMILWATASVLAERPKIVATTPKFWEIGVAPSAVKEVKVSFDRVMRSGFWDFLGNNVLPPPTNYETTMTPDLKSFGMRVNLQPGKVYILGLNERGIPGVGFQNDLGVSAHPAFLVFQTAGNPSAEDAPPRALSTSPGHASENVDPDRLKGIIVVFDQAMKAEKHGLHLFEEKKPVDLTKTTFSYSPDGKTFTLNYALKPSTHYEVVMNSTEDIGFATTNRVPLWPVRFSFATGQPH